MFRFVLRVVIALVLWHASHTLVVASQFEILYQFPSFPYGGVDVFVSADGQKAAWYDNGISRSMSWGGLFSASGLRVTGLSGDGNTIVGSELNYYTTPDGVVSSVDSSLSRSFSHSWLRDVSYDGSVVAGGDRWNQLQAMRWSQADGKQKLGEQFPDLVGDTFERSWANAVSADGSTVVGALAQNSLASYRGSHGFIWREEDLIIFPAINEGGMIGFNDASADGSIVVGGGGSTAGRSDQALIWTEEDGLRVLDTLNERGYFTHKALAISSDGSTIVGRSGVAAVWDEDGVHDLKTMLLEGGAFNVADYTLDLASDVSADGRYIVGYAHDSDRNRVVWRADIQAIPEPTSVALVLAFAIPLLIYKRACR